MQRISFNERVDKASGAVSFHDSKGGLILTELAGSRRAAPGPGIGQGFALQGPVFGLGQHLNGLFDYTGNTVHLQQAKRDVAVPMLVVRAGSILPLGPVVQHAGQKSDEPIELRIYPGQDAGYELYDDAGDGDGYTRGESAVRRFTRDQAGGQLTIAPWRGAYSGLDVRQAFVVRCGPDGSDKGVTVVAERTAISVKMPGCR